MFTYFYPGRKETYQSYPVALGIIFYIGFFIAFAVKLPIIPLHTWLLDTHREAHYSTCMLFAEILLKMGAHELIRINMELLSHANSLFSPWLMIIGTIQIIYAALTSLGNRELVMIEFILFISMKWAE
ncbi:NAD(P)H-quinone oxidoreductase chain 4 chloroplastic [Bienertia sinuspersici]